MSNEIYSKILVLITLASLGSLLSSTVSASTENESNFDGSESVTKKVSGRYVDSDLGLELEFPMNWTGVEAKVPSGGDIPIDKIVLVSPQMPSMPLPSNTTFLDYTGIIMIFSGDITDILSGEYASSTTGIMSEENEQSDSDFDCQTSDEVNIRRIGDQKKILAFEATGECSFPIGKLKMKIYLTGVQDDKIVYIIFAALSDRGYDDLIQDFEDTVSTVRLDETTDISDNSNYVSTGEFQLSEQTAVVEGNPYEIEILSNSEVSEFEFDEQNKRLSFTVSGQNGTSGTTSIEIGRVLEPPYNVKIDGSFMENGTLLISDATTGEYTLNLNYDHSVHEIEISGANVVPEFPIHMIAFVSGLAGIFALASRTRFWVRN